MNPTRLFPAVIFFLFVPFVYSESASLLYLNRVLNEEASQAEKGVERLASGRLLLTDDPANYALYEKLEGQIRGMDKAVANTGDLISFYQTEDGILENVVEVLQRIRELALRRMDGLLSSSEVEILDSEIGQLYEQVIDGFRQSQFNGIPLFGDLLNGDVVQGVVAGKDLYSAEAIDRLLDFLETQRTLAGTKTSTLEQSVRGQALEEQNTQDMSSHADTEFGAELSRLKRNQLLMMINLLFLKTKAGDWSE